MFDHNLKVVKCKYIYKLLYLINLKADYIGDI